MFYFFYLLSCLAVGFGCGLVAQKKFGLLK